MLVAHVALDVGFGGDQTEGLANVKGHHFTVVDALLDGADGTLALNNVLHHLMADALEHILRNSLATNHKAQTNKD